MALPVTTKKEIDINLASMRVRYAAPLYSGVGTPSFRDWTEAIENLFEKEEITSEESKVREAKSTINYTTGIAKDVIAGKVFHTWNSLKDHLRVFSAQDSSSLLEDIIRLINARWEKGTTVLQYTNTLLENLKKLISHPGREGSIKYYYEIMEAMVIDQLPDKLRQRKKREPFTVKDEASWMEFTKTIHLALLDERVHHVRTLQGTPRSIHHSEQQSKNKFTKGKRDGPTPYEVRTNRCGRCLNRGHFRNNCRSREPRCSYCSEAHEFFRCPRQEKRKKVSTIEVQDSPAPPTEQNF